MDKAEESFRPLAGIMVLIKSKSGGLKVSAKSFRPLAGIMVLIERTKKEIEENAYLFPSPCGDYGSYRRREGLQMAA